MYGLILVLMLTTDAESPVDLAPPIVEQTVDSVLVVHRPRSATLVMFWGKVQGRWACLAWYFWPDDAIVSRRDGMFQIAWLDRGDQHWLALPCYRVVRTAAWREYWTEADPRECIQGQMCGLAQP